VHKSLEVKQSLVRPNPLWVGLYTILPSPILYGVQHKRGRSVGGRILRNGRAFVLEKGRLCR